MGISANKVFFSYSRADSAFVLKLATDLRAAGVDLWLDQLDIPVGTQWDRAVEQALHACPSFLIVMTPQSVASENVLDEAAYAIEHKKQIVPILLHNCEIPFRLSRLQYIDFTGDYDIAFSRMLTVLKGEQGARAPAANPPATAPKSRTGVVLGGAALLLAVAGVSFVMMGDDPSIPDDERTITEDITDATETPDPLEEQEEPDLQTDVVEDLEPAVEDETDSVAESDVINDGAPESGSVEDQLLAANIVLSEGDIELVREWLDSDPAYLALAESCLEVLNGEYVFDAVPLDVINARYMESMGVSTEDYLGADEYGDLDKIREAIAATYRERYPNSWRQSFTDIAETR